MICLLPSRCPQLWGRHQSCIVGHHPGFGWGIRMLSSSQPLYQDQGASLERAGDTVKSTAVFVYIFQIWLLLIRHQLCFWKWVDNKVFYNKFLGVGIYNVKLIIFLPWTRLLFCTQSLDQSSWDDHKWLFSGDLLGIDKSVSLPICWPYIAW